MLDLNNLEYLIATKPEVTFTVAAVGTVLGIVILLPFLNIFAPLLKLLYTVTASGFTS